ncbi:hypothetical protein [Paracoccus alkanivorans]|uniref:Uncharacterized protein n=1 Tax=Paracoccus alkanivorans TaxID=2116655 RepID=A0A3M0MJG9_9RHOB|nr:hypothetical protein [Paracoccus alkanivorans]RMC37741.1 hypothetical protein C9E81_03110 [Paracoccus alkanivorans]
MSQFENHGLKAGTWSGVLTAGEAPARVALIHLGEVVSVARLAEAGTGRWQVSVDLPPALLADGVQSLVLVADGGEGSEAPLPDAVQLDRLHLAAGTPLDHTLTAEVQLLRAELELLKREIRRLATVD